MREQLKYKPGDLVSISKGEYRGKYAHVEGIRLNIPDERGNYPVHYVLKLFDDENQAEIFLTENFITYEGHFRSLYEMAGRLPGEIKVDKRHKLIVAVGADENMGEKHFHVFRNDIDRIKWRNSACLLFEENRYFDHSRHSEVLTKDELQALVDHLKKKHIKHNMTNWEYLITLWNDNNENFKIPEDLEMSEYNYKTIKRYREE